MQNENEDLLQSSYIYDLPPENIADRPVAVRHNGRLLVYRRNTKEVSHHYFYELPELLEPGDHLVLNNSKVFPCRLFGSKPTGGECEVFLLSLIAQQGLYPAMIKASGKRKEGEAFVCGELKVTLESIQDGLWVSFDKPHEQLIDYLEGHGNIPIPPYIRKGISDAKDKEDYQTVYAKDVGSVAAPTAGLHFTPEVFDKLKARGIEKSFVTLHVGAGTFKPVSSEKITEHKMHSEFFDIEAQELERINTYRGNLIAVGTTSLRVLESCFRDGEFALPAAAPFSTDIFLYPGVPVKSIKGLITNFHLPGSSLIMLVSSLIGRKKTLDLYQLAIAHNYRFYSYGDAMLIL